MPNAFKEPASHFRYPKVIDLDRRLVQTAKKIKVLTLLDWEGPIIEEFISHWLSDQPKLPRFTPRKIDLKEELHSLLKLQEDCQESEPLENFLRMTAESYSVSAEMLMNQGTPHFTELSIALYGKPKDSITGGNLSHLDAAWQVVKIAKEYLQQVSQEEEACITSSEVTQILTNELQKVFLDGNLQVAEDPNLASKAAASADRIRIRSGTQFSKNDVDQLIQHEGLVHALTMKNGRSQPILTSLGLSSPRSIRTQEGLATFSEFITASMDIRRLQQIALRIIGIQMGLDGADFIDIFQFFLEHEQPFRDAAYAAQRIFRGGDPKGKIIFTKDVVYLQGLISIHTFLRKAIAANKFLYPHYLFAGRLTLGDIIRLEPYFEDGTITCPTLVPRWIEKKSSLAAYLSYALFANQIQLDSIQLSDFPKNGL